MTTLTVDTLNSTYIIRTAPDVPGVPCTVKHLPKDGSQSRTDGVFVTLSGFHFERIMDGPNVQLVTHASTAVRMFRLRSSVVRSVEVDGVVIPVGAGVTRMGQRPSPLDDLGARVRDALR